MALSDGSYPRPRDWAAQVLRERILSGEYAYGSPLPPERTLASDTGVARMTLRAAIDMLIQEGLLIRRSAQGTFVCAEPARAKESPAIAVLHLAPELTSWPESAALLHGATQRLDELGYALNTIAYGNEMGRRKVVSTPIINSQDIPELSKRYAGMLLIETLGKGIQQQTCALEQRHYPVVVANLEHDLPVSCTWVDHARYIQQAVDILASLGHSAIAYLGQNSDEIYYAKLPRAYKAAMEIHNLPTTDSLLALTETNSSVSAYRTVKRMLDGPNPPTAFVSARDLYAQGACDAIQELGLVIGRDVSVFGFDNVSWQGRDPYVTTFHEPCYEMGAVAAEMLVDRISRGWRPVEKREIPAELIMRRTVGPAPESKHAEPVAPKGARN